MTDQREQALAARAALLESDNVVMRFWTKVDHTGDCWIWTRSCDEKGYGYFWLDGRNNRAHCVAWEMEHGPVPEGLQLDHRCRNTSCVRTSHLEPVPGIVNNERSDSPSAINARKTQCDHGHAYTAENTYTDTRGRRECRTCRRIKNREGKPARRARQKLRAVA